MKKQTSFRPTFYAYFANGQWGEEREEEKGEGEWVKWREKMIAWKRREMEGEEGKESDDVFRENVSTLKTSPADLQGQTSISVHSWNKK